MEDSHSFNINDFVKVRLNRKGVDIYYNYYYDLLGDKYDTKSYIPVIDEEGFTTIQLRHLMSIYGKYLYNGCDVPFETTIYFE